jgi:hypothetical protein
MPSRDALHPRGVGVWCREIIVERMVKIEDAGVH